MKIATIDMMQR